MEFELSFKNRKVRIWAWIMIPAFILTFALFLFAPKHLPTIVSIIPLIIGYLSYLYLVFREKRNRL